MGAARGRVDLVDRRAVVVMRRGIGELSGGL